jgi:DNA-binding beta-propeller fold protein YncE
VTSLRFRLFPVLFLALSPAVAFAQAPPSFVNWESPHVHPLDLTPDGSRLLAVNTADDRLEVFDSSGATLSPLQSIPVGLDPVSVRALSNDEVWVVNQVSDSVTIVHLSSGSVVRTLRTEDEPRDVVFAGTPQRAWVSCAGSNAVLSFDLSNLDAPPVRIAIDGEAPRALAVSPDGSRVYAAIFFSGNSTTILAGGAVNNIGFPPNVVNDSIGPYGGQNPPPNSGAAFNPPLNPANPAPPAVGLIVRKSPAGRWKDDNNGDWTDLVSGANAGHSGRPVAWDLADNDLAIIDTATNGVVYARHLMNICMAIGVIPSTGDVTIVGTEATNEVRFEPNVQGRFTRVEMARVAPVGPTTLAVVDLNPHLTYLVPTVPQSERDKSIGDPRGIAWNASGTKGYVTGLGSNNVIVINQTGARAGLSQTIPVGEGPTGVALDAANGRLLVLDKFEGAISVVDLSTETETVRVPFHDPSPSAIRVGRKHLYDTHKNSGLGQIACASCHVDARFDRLAWDLGNPAGQMKPTTGQNLGANLPGLNSGFQDWHPMKGPMTTQTLQDIIGQEPLHWRGDRAGLEEFNPAFIGLQGDDTNLTPAEMQEYEDFLATITFPPNPNRNFDNTLPTNMPLPGHHTTGRFSLPGQPLPNGNAQHGLQIYQPPRLLDGNVLACVTCHTLPTGSGTDYHLQGSTLVPFPIGPNGEHHRMLVSVDGSTNVTIKVPQLRSGYQKTGFDLTQSVNLAGYGVLHDGSVDSLERFVDEPVFTTQSDQETADLVAFLLAFSGSDLPQGSTNPFAGEPPGGTSKDSHAAVGAETTLIDAANPAPGQLALIANMIAQADTKKVGLVVKGVQGGIPRGYAYIGAGQFQSDRAAEIVTASALQAAAAPGSELTYTVVPRGTSTRIGIDRDLDGCLDRDELDGGSDPSDPSSHVCGPGDPYCFGDGTALTDCPCGNFGVAGRGCANSQPGSAGAWLHASGTTSPDTVVFTASGELPTALSIVLQGDTSLAIPASYGDGIRCTGGHLKRLYAKSAVAGVVTAPDTGDPSVTARSAALGDPIAPGSIRYYQVYHRDPAPAFCPTPTGGTFNVTNAYRITW